ncbi:MAG: hypothetical protein QRY74_00310 [Chlamydia sp.]
MRKAVDFFSVMAGKAQQIKKSPTKTIIIDEWCKSQKFYPSAAAIYPILFQMCHNHKLHIAAMRNAAFGLKSYRSVSAGFWCQNRQMNLEDSKKFIANL